MYLWFYIYQIEILSFTKTVKHLSMKSLNSEDIGSVINGGGKTIFSKSSYWVLTPDKGGLPTINS